MPQVAELCAYAYNKADTQHVAFLSDLLESGVELSHVFRADAGGSIARLYLDTPKVCNSGDAKYIMKLSKNEREYDSHDGLHTVEAGSPDPPRRTEAHS